MIDRNGPVEPWGKAAGDLNGDGVPDLIVGGHSPEGLSPLQRVLHKAGVKADASPRYGTLVWYDGKDRNKHVISRSFNVRTDVEVADVDGDGRNDVVAVTDQGVVWFRNPDWSPTVIGTHKLHDVEVSDLDGDGKLDVVARSQHLFGYKDGDWLHYYRQESPTQWVHRGVQLRSGALVDFGGEGLVVADIDGDSHPDVVINQAWLRNPGNLNDPASWLAVPYCTDWNWPHANLAVADINGDGRADIVMGPAEPANMFFRLSWCEAAKQPGAPWIEHVIDPRVETTMHSVLAGDLDGDGRVGIVTASMHISTGPKDVAAYRTESGGLSWSRTLIDSTGSHAAKLVDIDRDGDLDVFGANFMGDDQAVKLWVNQSVSRTAAGWRRHVIDDAGAWPSTSVLAADLDNDGLPDLLSGSRWYKNPGSAGARWQQASIGRGVHNVALVHDFDRDGRADVLASMWRGDPDWSLWGRVLRKLGLRDDPVPGGLVWARNLGTGAFEVFDNVVSGAGDFLQGVALLSAAAGDRIALSWHRPDVGVQQVQVPVDPSRNGWLTTPLSAVSQDEQLSAADVDRDGSTDLVLGTIWLRSLGSDSWTPNAIRQPAGKPDRNRVGDIDRDGRVDVVVGYEAVSKPGQLTWYQQGADPTRLWAEHVIGVITGPMSLSLADMDGDGDLDVIVGEHDLKHPASARLMWFENNLAG
ncbi:MAG: VCBS repeat-containing protein, partial [Aquincola sp.]|nr:VCBS repeat-containing protein [Aquincola sp.]